MSSRRTPRRSFPTSDKPHFFFPRLVTFFLMSFVGISAALAQKPLPADQQGYNQRQFRADVLRFRREEVQLYRQYTTDVEPVRTAGTLFLLRFHQRLALQAGAPDWPELLEEGVEVMNAGSRDPLILSTAAFTLIRAGRHQEAAVMLMEAWTSFEKDGYPIRGRLWTPERIRTVAMNINDRPGVMHWETIAGQAIVAWLKKEQITKDRARVIWNEVYLPNWKTYAPTRVTAHKAIVDALAEEESIDPWIRQMLQGTYYACIACESGLTADENINLQGARIEGNPEQDYPQAAAHFRLAHQLRPEFPEAATRMIHVSSATDDTVTPRDWFDRAVAAQFDYMEAYHAYRSQLSQMEEGSQQALYRFGLECAATERFDTDVPLEMIKVMDQLFAQTRDQNAYTKYDAYPACKKVLEGIAAEPARADDQYFGKNHTWAINKLIALAIQADQPEDAIALLAKYEDEIDRDLMRVNHINIERHRTRLHAMVGPHGPRVREIEKVLEDRNRKAGETEGFKEELLEIRAQFKDTRAQSFLDQLLSRMQIEADFEAGGWVDLFFDESFSNWSKETGSWTFVDKKTVFGEDLSTGSGMVLRQKVQFHHPFIIECDVESIFTHSQRSPGGFIIGEYDGRNPRASKMIGYVIDAQGGKVGYSTPFDAPMLADYVAPKKSKVRLKVAEGYFEFYIDDKYLAATEHDRAQTGPTVAIGVPFWFIGTGGVKFSNVRIRKWELGTPPPDTDFPAMEEYYTKAVHEEPNNPFHWNRLGAARYFRKNHAGAIEAFGKSMELPQFGLFSTRILLAASFIETGDFVRAIEHLEKSLNETVEHHPIRNIAQQYLALALAAAPDDSVRQGERALSMAKALCEASQYKDHEHLRLLAVAHAELGQFEEARKHIDAAIELVDDENREKYEKERDTIRQDLPVRLPSAAEIAAKNSAAQSDAAQEDTSQSDATRADEQAASPGEGGSPAEAISAQETEAATSSAD